MRRMTDHTLEMTPTWGPRHRPFAPTVFWVGLAALSAFSLAHAW
jgi:hypothetical protein